MQNHEYTPQILAGSGYNKLHILAPPNPFPPSIFQARQDDRPKSKTSMPSSLPQMRIRNKCRTLAAIMSPCHLSPDSLSPGGKYRHRITHIHNPTPPPHPVLVLLPHKSSERFVVSRANFPVADGRRQRTEKKNTHTHGNFQLRSRRKQTHGTRRRLATDAKDIEITAAVAAATAHKQVGRATAEHLSRFECKTKSTLVEIH